MRQLEEKNSNSGNVEDLLSPDPRKKILRYLFLVTGLLFVVASVVLLFTGIDLGVTLTMGTTTINISPILYFISLFLGLWVTAKFFIAPYKLRENSITRKSVDEYREPVKQQVTFFSSSHSRLAAALLFLAIAVVDMVYLTLHIGTPAADNIGGTYNGTGTAVVLGGVSFFYPVGLPLFIAGVSLAIYLIFSRFFGRFARSENFLFFHEFRFGVPWLTEVPRSHVEAVRYQNTHLGPKVLWSCFLIPYSIMVLQYGLPLFNQPRAETNILPTMMTLSAVGGIFALIFLLFWPQDYLEIASKDRLYEMWVAPTTNAFEVRDKIVDLFGITLLPHLKRKRREDSRASLSYERSPAATELSGINPTQRDFTQVLLGGVLLVIGILGAFASMFFGMLFWAGASTYGTFLLARGILSDFSNRDATRVTISEDGAFQYMRRFFRKFQCVFFPKTTGLIVENRPRKLEVVDILAVAWIVALGAYQTTLGWMITNFSVTIVVWESIGTTLIFGILLCLVIAYFIIPATHVVVKSTTITYTIPASPIGTAWGGLRYLRSRGKKAWQNKASRKILLFRLLTVLSIAIIATVVALTAFSV